MLKTWYYKKGKKKKKVENLELAVLRNSIIVTVLADASYCLK